MKELFQKVLMDKETSFLKAVNLYWKIKRNFQQDQISSTNCFFSRNTSTKSDFFQKLFLKNNYVMISYK